MFDRRMTEMSEFHFQSQLAILVILVGIPYVSVGCSILLYYSFYSRLN